MKRFIEILILFAVTGLVGSLLAQDDVMDDTDESDANKIAPDDLLPDELPENLFWQTNNDDPEFASPDAIRGGTFHTWMLAYPLTMRNSWTRFQR